MIKPLNTADHTTAYNKVLLYAMHGWGKTTQAKYYKEAYGNGLIISGESGLASVRSDGIDYVRFTAWDNENPNATKGDDDHSFTDITKWIMSDDFKSKDYKWIMIDSLTELSDHAMKWAESEANKKENLNREGKVNAFMIWDLYGTRMIGACKFIRDLPMHVVVTALAKEGEDDNGNADNWPMVKGQQVQKQLAGIFDCVFCGIKRPEQDLQNPTAPPRIVHYIIADEYKGWHGKARDEKRRLRAVEKESNIAVLLGRMGMSDEDYEQYLKTKGENK